MNTAVSRDVMDTSERLPAAPSSEAGAVLNMIERASRDPAVDIDKFQRLMEMRDKMEAREAERAYDKAMADAQAEMRPVAKDANNKQTQSKYASYVALDNALRPIYTRHGFSLSFYTGDGAPEGCVRVFCKVTNRGHIERPHLDMPADGKGAKGGDVMTKTHATGSAVSYGMRYLLTMIFNIARGDDDGNAAGGGSGVVTDAQADAITKLVREAKVDVNKLLKRCEAASISDILAADYPKVIGALQQKIRDAQGADKGAQS